MSVSGRLAHEYAERCDGIARAMSRAHSRLFRMSNGKFWSRLRHVPLVQLQIVGRKTGMPRSVMVLAVRDGEAILVCGSNAGHHRPPSWSLNLKSSGSATVLENGRRWDAISEELAGIERASVWAMLVRSYPDFEDYDRRSNRELPIFRLSPKVK